MKITLLSLLFALLAFSTYATRIYVDVDKSNNNGDGLSWENAKRAIGTASGIDGVTEIWIKAGTYAGIISNQTFKALNGIKVYGGFKGTETCIDQREKNSTKPYDFKNETIIDGQETNVCLVLQAMESDNETLFDGIIFKKGGGSIAAFSFGNADAKNVTIQNCRFEDNASIGARSGALYFSNAYNVKVIDCLFQNNSQTGTTSGGNGGGALFLVAKDNNNKISGCEFYGNSSVKGGALFLNGSDENGTEVSNCVFTGNSVSGSSGIGGAFHSENAANRFYNLLVANNEGTSSVVNLYTGSSLYYSTIVKNKGGVNGGTSSKIKNCIVWGNTNASGSAVTISSSSSDVENNALYTSESTGKIDEEELTAAPGFVAGGSLAGLDGASENTDYSLTSSSSLLNKAVVIDGIETDMAGNSRVIGTSGDLGAYECSITTWTGKGEQGKWDDTDNWSVGVPGASDIVDIHIPANASNILVVPNNTSVKTITFERGAQADLQGSLAVTESVNVKYKVVPGKWYSIGFPFETGKEITVRSEWFEREGWSPLRPYKAEGYGDNYGDYWIKYYNPSSETYFEDTQEAIAPGKGYIIQFPTYFNNEIDAKGDIITFSSGPQTLSNGSSLPVAENYQLVANPLLKNIELQASDGNKHYYCLEDNETNEEYKLLESGTKNLAPFEAAITIATENSEALALTIGVNNEITGIGNRPAIGGNDPVVATRFYTLQGIEIKQALENGIYIVKKYHDSGKESVEKIICKQR